MSTQNATDIVTKDSVTAQADAVVYFYIQDSVASVLQVENAKNVHVAGDYCMYYPLYL